MPLTFKKRKFAEALTRGLPAQQAALAAGYRDGRGLKVTASRLLRDRHVVDHMTRLEQFAHLPARPATTDPLKFLLALMADPREPPVLRLEAAIAAAPYRHPRLPAKRPAR
ncbi:hypothetical protein [Azonexus sp.]|uniref:hypothetical protein n=1 Tax=Azonexus sp. TaxID=1872668 RepID=UPI0035B3900C